MVKEKVEKEEEICNDCAEYGSDFCDECLEEMKKKKDENKAT